MSPVRLVGQSSSTALATLPFVVRVVVVQGLDGSRAVAHLDGIRAAGDLDHRRASTECREKRSGSIVAEVTMTFRSGRFGSSRLR